MAIVQLRVDDELKNQASNIYEKLGIDLSSAIRMFLKRSVLINGIPFTMRLDDIQKDSQYAFSLLQTINDSAKKSGTSEMTLNEINTEIASCRKGRRNKK